MKLTQRLINSQYKILPAPGQTDQGEKNEVHVLSTRCVLVFYANKAMQTWIRHFILHNNIKQCQVIHDAMTGCKACKFRIAFDWNRLKGNFKNLFIEQMCRAVLVHFEERYFNAHEYIFSQYTIEKSLLRSTVKIEYLCEYSTRPTNSN